MSITSIFISVSLFLFAAWLFRHRCRRSKRFANGVMVAGILLMLLIAFWK
jgi:uncharacterized membrane protein (GlpM family)